MRRPRGTYWLGLKILISVMAAAAVCGVHLQADAEMEYDYTEYGGGEVPDPEFIAPLASEGFLWAPVLSPEPDNLLAFKFGFAFHDFDYSGDDVEAFTFNLTLSGEYTFFDELTVGADIPFLFGYDISSDWVDDSGVDFGAIRLHLRYPVLRSSEPSLVLTPAFRLWLPTNTYLTVEDVPLVGELDIVDSLAVFEPMMLIGYSLGPASLIFETGPKFFAVEDQDDFSFWSFNLVAGYAPTGVAGLEFVLEFNMLVELDEDDAPSATDVESAVPLGISTGARYHFGSLVAELALRIGLHDAEFYYSDFNVGLQIGYLLN